MENLKNETERKDLNKNEEKNDFVNYITPQTIIDDSLMSQFYKIKVKLLNFKNIKKSKFFTEKEKKTSTLNTKIDLIEYNITNINDSLSNLKQFGFGIYVFFYYLRSLLFSFVFLMILSLFYIREIKNKNLLFLDEIEDSSEEENEEYTILIYISSSPKIGLKIAGFFIFIFIIIYVVNIGFISYLIYSYKKYKKYNKKKEKFTLILCGKDLNFKYLNDDFTLNENDDNFIVNEINKIINENNNNENNNENEKKNIEIDDIMYTYKISDYVNLIEEFEEKKEEKFKSQLRIKKKKCTLCYCDFSYIICCCNKKKTIRN